MKRFIFMLLLSLGMACSFALVLQGREMQETEVNEVRIQELEVPEPKAQELEVREPEVQEPGMQETEAPEPVSSIREAAEQERLGCLKELAGAQDRRQWFVSYKELLVRQQEILDCPATLYDSYDQKELDLLFRVVQAEIGDEYSFEQKCNVASVIFNRTAHPQFGSSLETVLIPSQFATISNGRYEKVTVSEDTILACEYSFMLGDTTGGCLFFDSNGSLRYQFVFNDGAHNFYTLKDR